MEILVSPNSFKGTFSSVEASNIIAKALKDADSEFNIKKLPIADGGDGTMDVFKYYFDYKSVKRKYKNPLGNLVETEYIILDDNNTAIIEFANASGLNLIDNNQNDLMKSSSYGTGQQIKSAIKKGVKNILLCLGGSATIDGGTGILSALGVKFYNSSSNEITKGNPLMSINKFDVSSFILNRKEINFTLLSDVTNPLIGTNGSVRTFGRQKGLRENDFSLFEKNLDNFSVLTDKYFNSKTKSIVGGGAAGGACSFLKVFFNANLNNGADYILDKIKYNSKILNKSIIVTGEGSLDSQTLYGKAPFTLANYTKEKTPFCIAIGGIVDYYNIKKLLKNFDLVFAACESQKKDYCIRNAKRLLYNVSFKVGKIISYKLRIN